MSRIISSPTLTVPLENPPWRNKASILCFLPLAYLGNPSQWITCWAFLQLRMETTLFLWSSIDYRRWPLWQPARRISQQKPLLNSSLNECGYTLGSHSISSQIKTVGSLVHFGPTFGRCWTPSLPSIQLSIPKLMARQRSLTKWLYELCACATQSIHTKWKSSIKVKINPW